MQVSISAAALTLTILRMLFDPTPLRSIPNALPENDAVSLTAPHFTIGPNIDTYKTKPCLSGSYLPARLLLQNEMRVLAEAAQNRGVLLFRLCLH